MPNVKLVSDVQGDSELEQLYKQIEEKMGEVSPTFQAMANFPDYLKMVLGKMELIMGSDGLDMKTKLAIAFTVSTLNNCEMCITMYADKLRKVGFTDKQFVEIMGLIDLVGSMNHFNNGMLIKPGK